MAEAKEQQEVSMAASGVIDAMCVFFNHGSPFAFWVGSKRNEREHHLRGGGPLVCVQGSPCIRTFAVSKAARRRRSSLAVDSQQPMMAGGRGIGGARSRTSRRGVLLFG